MGAMKKRISRFSDRSSRALFVIAVAAAMAACGGTETVSTAQDQPAPAADDETLDLEDSGSVDEVIDDGSGPLPINIELLTSGSWTLRFGGGPEGEVAIVDGYPITVVFDSDGSYGGTAACNGYGGSYELDGFEFSLGQPGQEDAGCAVDVQASEAAFLEALRDVTDINLSPGELALSGPASELIFAQVSGANIEELWGRSFVLEATLADEVPTPAAGEPAFFAINPDNSFLGSTGCRDLDGTFVVAGAEVVFTDFGASGECAASLAGQDGHVVTVLGDGFTYELESGQLLISSVGNQGLQYRETTGEAVVDAPGAAAPSDAEVLAGISWIFAGGDGPDGAIADPRTIDPEAVITLNLADGEYSGEAVCNGYVGTSEIGESLASIALGPAEGEEEGCGDGLDEIINAYLSALPQMLEGGLDTDGRGLVLNDGVDIELQFERAN